MNTPASTSFLAVLQQVAAGFAVHALWQVPLLAGAAWIAIRTGRPHARIAHALWCGTLLLCLLLPVCATWAGRSDTLRAERERATVSLDMPAYACQLPAFKREIPWLRFLHRHASLKHGIQPVSFTLPQRWAHVAARSYLLITLFFALRLVISWWRMRRIVERASPAEVPETFLSKLRTRCAQLHIAVPECRLSEEIPGPAIAGVMRPLFLLPKTLHELTAEEIEAVLAHELAHLRRRDPLLNVACAWLLLPLGFHPATFWIARRMRQTREMACDAEAAATLGSAEIYAAALLQIAGRAASAVPLGWGALHFFNSGLLGMRLNLFNGNGTLEERMRMLIDGNKRPVRGHVVRMAGCLAVAAAAVLTAGMLQVQPALASEQPQQTAPVAQAPLPAGEAGTQAGTADEKGSSAQPPKADRAPEQTSNVPGNHQSDLNLPAMPAFDFNFDLPKTSDEAALRMQTEMQQEIMAKLQVQMNSPEWKAQLEQQHKLVEQMQSMVNSPQWKAQIETQREMAAKIEAQVNSRQWKAQMEKQREMVARVQAQLQSPEFRAQIDAASKLAADRVATMPAPRASFAAPAEGEPLRVAASVLASNNTHKENPVYPAEAKQKDVQGAVVLHVLVDETGKVENAFMMSSPDPMLTDSAIAAVQQWTYKPFLLNGAAVPVESTVTVTYSLAK